MSKVHDRNIKDASKQLAGNFLKNYSTFILCTVDSVDEGNSLCACTPISGPAITGLENVLLQAEANDGLLLIPRVGSTVMVGTSTTDVPFVAMFEDIDKVKLKIGGSTLEVTDGLFKFNGGSLGGLTKTQELKTQIDKDNEILNIILTTLTGTIIDEPGNGAPSALQAALSLALAGKAVGNYSNIENEAIKQ